MARIEAAAPTKKAKAKSSKTKSQDPDSRRTAAPLIGSHLRPRPLPFAAPPLQAVEGDRYELAHHDYQSRDLHCRPRRVDYEVQEASPDKELQPQRHVIHHPPGYVRAKPDPECFEDCPCDADKDHQAPHEQQGAPQNV